MGENDPVDSLARGAIVLLWSIAMVVFIVWSFIFEDALSYISNTFHVAFLGERPEISAISWRELLGFLAAEMAVSFLAMIGVFFGHRQAHALIASHAYPFA